MELGMLLKVNGVNNMTTKEMRDLKEGDWVEYQGLKWKVYVINPVHKLVDIEHHAKGYYAGRKIEDLKIIK